jgi:hypothetical protein
MTVPTSSVTWTGRLRSRALRSFPPDDLLPDRQPIYVASWIYVFGVLTLAAFLVVLVSGCILAIEGPQWWHLSSAGHFVNSPHLWSVELFMAFMVIHLWGKFWMAAWRGKRAMTWVNGGRVLLGLGRHRLHRLSGADELRLAVDQHPGKGRAELRGHRFPLQRVELRPDADVAHRAPARCGRCRRRHPRAAGSASW